MDVSLFHAGAFPPRGTKLNSVADGLFFLPPFHLFFKGSRQPMELLATPSRAQGCVSLAAQAPCGTRREPLPASVIGRCTLVPPPSLSPVEGQRMPRNRIGSWEIFNNISWPVRVPGWRCRVPRPGGRLSNDGQLVPL